MNINTGKPWSPFDLRDLQDGIDDGTPVTELADFLFRDVAEVEAKIAELRGTEGDSGGPPALTRDTRING
jgi:hypothetical protein